MLLQTFLDVIDIPRETETMAEIFTDPVTQSSGSSMVQIIVAAIMTLFLGAALFSAALFVANHTRDKKQEA